MIGTTYQSVYVTGTESFLSCEVLAPLCYSYTQMFLKKLRNTRLYCSSTRVRSIDSPLPRSAICCLLRWDVLCLSPNCTAIHGLCFILKYSWPLNNVCLNDVGPLIHGCLFFNKQSPCFVSPRFPSMDAKYCFWSTTGSLRMWRAECMHCSAPFDIRDLSIHRLWCLREVLQPIPMDTEELELSFWGVKNYTRIFDCAWIRTPNPLVIQGSAVLLMSM